MTERNDSLPDEPLDEKARLLTAWVDGVLSPADRVRFDLLIADDAELMAQATAHKELLDLSRSMHLVEPSDREARRFWSRFYNRSEWRLGWCLLLGGAVLLLGFAVEELIVSDLPTLVKVGACAVLLGAAILLWNTFRLRLRTSRFDRYRGVLY